MGPWNEVVHWCSEIVAPSFQLRVHFDSRTKAQSVSIVPGASEEERGGERNEMNRNKKKRKEQ